LKLVIKRFRALIDTLPIASFIDGISVLPFGPSKRITITLGDSYSHNHSFNVIVQGVCKAKVEA
jgi:hypothetical protein